MKKVIYCKYNMNRSPKFQTRTEIIKDSYKKYILKAPVSDEGIPHLASFQRKYEESQKIYPALSFIEPKVNEDTVSYPFIIGTPIEESMYRGDYNADTIITEIKKVIASFLTPSSEVYTDFKPTDEFKEIFGDVDCSNKRCMSPCNVDMILDNIIIVGDKATVFDYEWVFDLTIPEKYVIYRLLCRVYDKKFDVIQKDYSIQDFIAQFGIDIEEQSLYRTMEDNFIKYVYGDGNVAFTGNAYLKERKKLLDYDFYKKGYQDTLDILHETEAKLIEEIDIYSKLCAEHAKLSDEHLRLIDDHTALIDARNLDQEQLRMKDEYIAGLQYQLDKVTNSLSWKMTKPIRGITKVSRHLIEKVPALKMLEKKDVEEVSEVTQENFVQTSDGGDTTTRIREYLNRQSEAMAKEAVTETEHKISLITPLFNTPKEYLVDLLESVINQTSPAWELSLVNYSDKEHSYVEEVCKEYQSKDERILYHKGENKGIAENSNECAAYTTGDYIGVLDHDDILSKYAIEEVIRLIEAGADFIYSDEAKFHEKIEDAFYINIKPDFSADELRVHNYICHFNVFSKKLFKEIGGYRKEFDGSQDHDLVLRLTEKAEVKIHIPEVLYYWRVHDNSVAKNIEAKPYATTSGERAVTAQLVRMGYSQCAKSVINNIPCYKIRKETDPRVLKDILKGLEEETLVGELSMSETDEHIQDYNYSIVLWGHESDDEYKTEKEKYKATGIKCFNANKYNNDFNKIMESTRGRYIIFIRCGLSVNIEELRYSMDLYHARTDVSSFDAKVIGTDNMILSGGTYSVDDENMPIRIRCMGGGEDYLGYEDTLLFTREVISSIGLFSVIDRQTWKAMMVRWDKEGSTKTHSNKADNLSQAIIRYTFSANDYGMKNIFIPYNVATGADASTKSELVNNLSDIKIAGRRDPYFNIDILDLKYE